MIFIKHTSAHHASHSGYNRILDYMEGDIISGSHSPIPYRIRKVLASMVSDHKGIYDSSSVQKESRLIQYMLRHPHGLAHFLNGERDVRFSTYLKNVRNWKFTATFHHPPGAIASSIKMPHFLKRLDGAVAVGINQLQLLHEMVGGDAITYIPHGVDTSFFIPGKENYDCKTALFVGQHLRDFETLSTVVEQLSKIIPGFKLQVVLRNDFTHLIPKAPYIEVWSGISDEKLRSLYQEAALLLLPLKEVTACNAILEALACGLPIVTNNLEGNRGYLAEKCSFLIDSGSTNSFVEAVKLLMEDSVINHKMRIESRNQSHKFSWPSIAGQLSDYFKKYFT